MKPGDAVLLEVGSVKNLDYRLQHCVRGVRPARAGELLVELWCGRRISHRMLGTAPSGRAKCAACEAGLAKEPS